jgi:hypothetical protein
VVQKHFSDLIILRSEKRFRTTFEFIPYLDGGFRWGCRKEGPNQQMKLLYNRHNIDYPVK